MSHKGSLGSGGHIPCLPCTCIGIRGLNHCSPGRQAGRGQARTCFCQGQHDHSQSLIPNLPSSGSTASITQAAHPRAAHANFHWVAPVASPMPSLSGLLELGMGGEEWAPLGATGAPSHLVPHDGTDISVSMKITHATPHPRLQPVQHSNFLD